jgi:hypothetical protein
MKPRLAQTLRLLTLPALFYAALCPARAEKLFEFGFNESGPFAISSVDAKSQIALILKNAKGDSADLHGPAGSGVSGKPNDRAFDASSASGMGKGVGDASDPSRGINYGPVASADEDTGLASGLESYTIQGWFKADREVLGQVARLVCFSIDGGKSAIMDLGASGTGGTLYYGCGANGEAAKVNLRATPNAFWMIDTWVFFAVTYSKDTFTFYVGSTVETVARAGVSTSPGKTADLRTTLQIGNVVNRQRPFKGWMDNVRVFGAKTGESGALSLQDLETLRVRDVRGE